MTVLYACSEVRCLIGSQADDSLREVKCVETDIVEEMYCGADLVVSPD